MESDAYTDHGLTVQDFTFHERVVDLANMVLVCLVGPEAEHSMAAAVDPEREQVLRSFSQLSMLQAHCI